MDSGSDGRSSTGLVFWLKGRVFTPSITAHSREEIPARVSSLNFIPFGSAYKGINCLLGTMYHIFLTSPHREVYVSQKSEQKASVTLRSLLGSSNVACPFGRCHRYRGNTFHFKITTSRAVRCGDLGKCAEGRGAPSRPMLRIIDDSSSCKVYRSCSISSYLNNSCLYITASCQLIIGALISKSSLCMSREGASACSDPLVKRLNFNSAVN